MYSSILPPPSFWRKAKKITLPPIQRKQPHRYGTPTGFRRAYYITVCKICQYDCLLLFNNIITENNCASRLIKGYESA